MVDGTLDEYMLGVSRSTRLETAWHVRGLHDSVFCEHVRVSSSFCLQATGLFCCFLTCYFLRVAPGSRSYTVEGWTVVVPGGT